MPFNLGRIVLTDGLANFLILQRALIGSLASVVGRMHVGAVGKQNFYDCDMAPFPAAY